MAKDVKAMLQAKLAENTKAHADAHQEANFNAGKTHSKLPVDLIDPSPYQPRTHFPDEEIARLAETIKEVGGIIQPITVRKVGERYELIAGERRLRAHKLLRRSHIEVLIVDLTDAEAAMMALIENIQREDLCDFEIGKGIRAIEKLFPNKKQLAEAVGLNREDMYKYFAFEVLPADILEKLAAQPKLLGRSAAVEIKKVLQNNEEALVAAPLRAAWALLEAGKLDQSKMAEWISKELRVAKDGGGPANHEKVAPLPLLRGGKEVGQYDFSDKKLVVKFNKVKLNEDQQKRLKDFIANLVTEEV
jgi:ParB family chromosome partitioning protein